LGDFDVSKVQESSENTENVPLSVDGDTNSRQSSLSVLELFAVIHTWNWGRRGSTTSQVSKGIIVGPQGEIFALFGRRTGEELIENVVIPF